MPSPFLPLTPHKLPHLLLAPSYTPGDFDSHMIDCPFPFRHNNAFYMLYLGWDTIGYRTGLATSTDLLHWKKLGLLIDRGPKNSPTEFNVSLSSILRDNALFGPSTLLPVDGHFIGTYQAYPAPGYEAGPATIGLCRSTDLLHWKLEPPILRANDKDAAPWEQGGLYKSFLMQHANTYYLFYNAKDKPDWPWIETTGVATSTDLKTWTRHPQNPLLKNGPAGAFDDLFASDPMVFHHQNLFYMFYFGNSSDGHARDSYATSPDLLHWTKSNTVLIDVGAPGAIDSLHAHKPGIITHDNTLYHFYCAVRPATPQDNLPEGLKEVRGIALATSKPMDAAKQNP